MAISKSQPCSSSLGSCNTNPSSSSSSRNRNNKVLALPSSSSMLFVLLAVIFMLATGLAEPYESTTITAELEGPYTEVIKQDITNFQFKTAADDLEDDNFGSLSEGGLEQDIRDAVKSEVESEIEAGAFDFVLARRDEHSMTPDRVIVTHRDDTDDGNEVANSREAKTLESVAVAKEESTESPEPAAEAESESKLETPSDSQTAESRHRPLPNITSDLVSVIFNEDRAITEQPITKINLLALEHQHKDLELRDTTPAPYVYDPPKHQVTKKQGVEDLLPIEPPVVPEAEDDFIREDRKLKPETNALLEPIAVTHLPDIEENINVKDPNPQQETSSSPKPLVTVEAEEADAEPKVEQETAETEATSEGKDKVPENAVESDNKRVVHADEDVEGAEETTISVDRPVKTTTELNYVAEASTDVVFDNETTTKLVEAEEEPIKVESIDRADDSTGTATPLVSYPPHDADQTFDSNLADERTAHLSLSSTSRSTLIIALCSGTAVIFIIISLVIFVVSFQRQHGTLDIEMQEQRLGKDSLDEEDAQLKLLDVDLSAPAILVSMGNEETDECL
ncbi:histone transcription regulator 3 homolog isoform X2 [Drosophila willistoni]|uniref:histone transcription regulator 3 homolog isoform X2 n=1 Tax=Drosophila willistoni TaxID=7260 RepID=UPI00017D9163|nr:histone transcription regulator 3 homolog isoform X2 [Drosophila willistoni]